MNWVQNMNRCIGPKSKEQASPAERPLDRRVRGAVTPAPTFGGTT